jgi:hypothetical protein
MTDPLTDAQRSVLLHMTAPGRTTRHYAADDGGGLCGELTALAALGLVTGPHRNEVVYPGLAFFYATRAGERAAKQLREGGTDER